MHIRRELCVIFNDPCYRRVDSVNGFSPKITAPAALLDE